MHGICDAVGLDRFFDRAVRVRRLHGVELDGGGGADAANAPAGEFFLGRGTLRHGADIGYSGCAV
jgi:hypothetical protein